MGQDDVFQFLKNNKGNHFSAKEIAEKLKLNYGAVSRSLFKLRKHGEVQYLFFDNTYFYFLS
jgi:DNA-binding MarR family transcriptional regulator